MFLPSLLFALFAFFSGAGAYLILAHHRGRKAGALGALVVILLFAALYAGVLSLLGDAAAGG